MAASKVDPPDTPHSLGTFIRNQRRLSALSLRQLGELTSVSNAYLSQIERGLHQPSLRVVRAIANALDVSMDVLLSHADGQVGVAGDGAPTTPSVEAAIAADASLTAADRRVLIELYRRLSNPAT